MQPDTDIISGLLHTIDVVRAVLGCIEATGEEGDNAYPTLVEELRHLASGGAEPVDPEDPVVDTIGDSIVLFQHLPEQEEPEPTQVEPAQVEPVEADEEPEDTEVEEERDLYVLEEIEDQEDEEDELAADDHDEETSAAEKSVSDAPLGVATPTPPSRRKSISETSVRVDVAVLDTLMNLVGELVLTRNQIIQYASDTRVSALLPAFQRLNLLTTELQDGVMQTRMQPIKGVWNKFPRVVRDLAVACDKKVRLEMEGEQTELDRTLIEAIKDPLTHIVRNSVDHGIELPAERAAAGKSEEGFVHLRAYHEGGQVNIEITDDGRGIDRERVKAKALEQRMITQAQAERLTDREIFQLIASPGFSTAEHVTHISGRGVGMDVVRTEIEKIGGNMDIQSVAGQSTTIRLKIPLTLAIIPALFVRCGAERFAIPQITLQELVRLDPGDLERNIERIHNAEVYRLRDRLLPIVHLRDVLGMPRLEHGADDLVNIIVLHADEHVFGLVVDEIFDTEEIVVKPLSSLLKNLRVYAGATIMGDGQVALILDIGGIAQLNTIEKGRPQERGVDDAAVQQGDQNMEPLLLCSMGREGRVAIPMTLIDRLEEFEEAKVEAVGVNTVVQYRGELLPVVYLSDLLGEPRATHAPGDIVQVVVFSRDGRNVGLIVDDILDIVQASTRGRPGWRRGVQSLSIIDGHVTECLDMDYVFSNAG
ncbi:MAG: chemotaxis protein CheA [Myxococcota bacterium]